MRVKIKVCGITDERDAIEAVYLGVDALGFVFSPGSPRTVTARQAAAISSKLPPFVARVGVFSDEKPQAIVETADSARLTAVQLHGDEPPAACRCLPLPWYKAFRMTPGFALERLSNYACTAYLIEGDPGERGSGASPRADWDLARAASRYGRVILSGGLTASNVERAIEHVRPYAVNVSGGVEFRPGVKDIEQLELFVAAVRRTEQSLALREQDR